MPLYDRDYMRQPPSRKPSMFSEWTPLHWIIAVNILVFCVQHLGFGLFVEDETGRELGGVSITTLAQGKFWTAFTYMFVHGTVMHLLGNLLLIGFIGHRLQGLLGPRSFMLIYFISGLVGAGVQMVVDHYARPGINIEIIGASACACGLLLAYASIIPDERITTLIYFIIPVTARLWTLAIGLMSLELVLGTTALFTAFGAEHWGTNAYFAHLGGAFAGWNFVRLMGYGGNPMTYERLWRERRTVSRPQRREVARVRRERAMPEIDTEAARRRQQQPGRNTMPIMDDVDTILDKISIHGIASLSDDERKTLDSASRDLARKNAKPQA